MVQKQINSHLISNIGIFAAFGVLTMSSSFTATSNSTLNSSVSLFFESAYTYNNTGDLCSSLMQKSNQMGDILVASNLNEEFVQEHKKINVNLQITKINKHVSNFDFDDEYEEI